MLGMVNPVLSGVQSEGKVAYGISVNFVIELEEDTETGVCEDGMRRLGKNVII
jgi:hypothetical protein